MTHYGQDDDDHHHDDDDGSEEELSEEDSDLESLVSVSDVHWNVPNTIGVGSRLRQRDHVNTQKDVTVVSSHGRNQERNDVNF